MSALAVTGIAATRRSQARLGYLLIAPVLVLVVVFLLFPVVSAVWFATTDWNGVDLAPGFVGLANFREMFGDGEFWNALGNNAVWVVIGTVAPVLAGLLLAVTLWSGVGGVLFYRLVFFLPHVMPIVAVGIAWSWIYDPVNGWLNRALDAIGLAGVATGWLGDPGVALYAVLGAAVWATYGFAVVIFIAALQNVDLDLVDAARIDGANAARRLWHIILPQILPVFLMITTVTLLAGISVFDIVFVMTDGGPGNATQVLGTYAYENAFELGRVGYGTALALCMMVLSVPCMIAMNRLQKRMLADGTPR